MKLSHGATRQDGTTHVASDLVRAMRQERRAIFGVAHDGPTIRSASMTMSAARKNMVDEPESGSPKAPRYFQLVFERRGDKWSRDERRARTLVLTRSWDEENCTCGVYVQPDGED